MIRVLIAEDQTMVRGALAILLDLEADIDVVDQVGRGDEAVTVARRERPDVALLDIEMPGLDGLEAAAAMHRDLPSCTILMLTTFGRPGYLRRAIEAGATGFLVKDGPVEELADAIRRAVRGERVIDPTLAVAALSTGPNPLTAGSGTFSRHQPTVRPSSPLPGTSRSPRAPSATTCHRPSRRPGAATEPRPCATPKRAAGSCSYRRPGQVTRS